MRTNIFELQPLQGIGPFQLGMSIAEVDQVFEALDCQDVDRVGRPKFDRSFLNSFQIEYNQAGLCWAVGTYWSPDCGYECTINGMNLQSYSAEQLFEYFSKNESKSDIHVYKEQSKYIFPETCIILFDHCTSHDYLKDGQRLMYGEIIVAMKEYIAHTNET